MCSSSRKLLLFGRYSGKYCFRVRGIVLVVSFIAPFKGIKPPMWDFTRAATSPSICSFTSVNFSDKFDSNIIVSLNQCHSKQYKTPIPYPLTHYLLKHFTKPHFLDILDIFSLDMSRISSNQLTKFCLSSFYDIFAWACPKVKISRQILEEKVT